MNILSDEKATDLNYSTTTVTCYADMKIITYLIQLYCLPLYIHVNKYTYTNAHV